MLHLLVETSLTDTLFLPYLPILVISIDGELNDRLDELWANPPASLAAAVFETRRVLMENEDANQRLCERARQVLDTTPEREHETASGSVHTP
jgi:hypothetical protein